ncbi:hypothetical protein CALK_2462 [Chitinivibrio alkaliphilus ACht1]|uniref:Methyltransferase n=1 Tax=Chitinivibrio alkaliphilus ACht1 TaxID=1313304 RepID=U7D2J0_9BACT|nr:hypothetical protein CALK_2462 [Chitinivibrio alkaliphilus ACht1]
MSTAYEQYEMHYAHVGNTKPDWETALKSPKNFACTKPWLPENTQAKILDLGCGWGINYWHYGQQATQILKGFNLFPARQKLLLPVLKIVSPLPVWMDGNSFRLNHKAMMS